LDYAIAHDSWIDPERLGVTGLSYGGYMTNWAVTQTARFKAAVAMGSLSNLIAFYGTSLYQDLIEAEFNGMPWDRPQRSCTAQLCTSVDRLIHPRLSLRVACQLMERLENCETGE
jgi:poly(3-hydroxybutyrate) depolymerase